MLISWKEWRNKLIRLTRIYCIIPYVPAKFFVLLNIRNGSESALCESFLAKPDLAMGFISLGVLMNSEALGGFAMPDRASASSNKILH